MIPLIGLIIGALMGLALQNVFVIPVAFARYLSIATLAALDSAFGGLRASLEKKFEDKIFAIGFISNALMAAFITYLGDKLGVDLFLAAIVVFGVRIFQNLGLIRRLLIDLWQK
jgi:small basic protein